MNVLRAIISELIGLFVDDGLFATSIVLCAALVGFFAPVAGIPAKWRAVLLFVGLAVILIESVLRRARS
ncbi:MAG: hypothetical protein ABIS14_15860 [Sphingomonas sp.]